MTFRNSSEHCGRLDCACSAKRELAFELVSEILLACVIQGVGATKILGGANIIELSWGSGGRFGLNAFDNRYCNSVCDELQRFKYESKNRLKPGWSSMKWNGDGYSAKIMFWARSWTAAEASAH